ncbi:MAG: hypothetical protein EU543_05165 [Promethearchaeota archaeon]|nr:MAG: hypothetical protein EU543_05165 [Candidatus Lokiarchaeota archaeon]
MPSKEEITELAYRRYKSGESYEKSIWYLAYYTLKINKNIKNGGSIQPLETDNLILLLNDNINGSLLEPDEEEIRDLAENIYYEHPEKSKLHWFIAEKLLLLKEIEDILHSNQRV